MSERRSRRCDSMRGASRRKVLFGSSAALLLSSCGALDGFGEDELPPAGTVGKAAFIAPLSGPRASIGQIMRDAASLGGVVAGPLAEIEVIDGGDSDEMAVAAARRAVDGGAKMIAGPLFSGQSRAVAAAVGRGVPVVSLSNDAEIAGGNLFVFGVTADQSARTIFGFAATRGKARVGIVVPPGELGIRFIAAARVAAQGFGLTLGEPVVAGDTAGLIDRLRAASGGTMPDAVFLPVASGPFAAQAAALGGAGVQILGSNQWSTIEPWRTPGLRNAWFSAPDPIRFEAFALAFEEATGQTAGVVGGLAFDAAEMVRLLGRRAQQNAAGLTREAGFDGVVGPYRFLASGQCERGLAVLNVAEGHHDAHRRDLCVRRRAPDAGVTLVEMLVALALFALVGLASFTTLDTIVKARARTEGRLEAVSAIDRTLLLFGRDLAQAAAGTVRGDAGTVQVGPQERTLIWGLVDGAVVRQGADLLRDTTGPEQSLISGVATLRLRYLDAARMWHEAWPVEAADGGLIGVELILERSEASGTIRRIVALAGDGT